MIVAGALLVAGAAHADPQLEARVKSLEAKVKKLEDDNARYAEALSFLEKVYQQQKAQQVQVEHDTPAEGAMWAVPIAADIANGQIVGPAGAAVTIVWAFDFADPYSSRMVPVMDELLAQYKGKVRIVWKNMIVHPQIATTAHAAGCAAGKQRKFAEFWHQFWKDGYQPYTSARDVKLFDTDHLATYAGSAGLDSNKLKTDLASSACDSLVKADMAELAAFHVNSTPTFFINGEEIAGAMPKERFEEAIDAKLKLVAASGVPAAKYYDQVVLAKGEPKFRSKLERQAK
jgi:protein-disulfide isomerase